MLLALATTVRIVVSSTMIAPGLERLAGSTGVENRTVISPLRPKPSSALTEVTFGVKGSAGALTVPSVLPFRNKSVGYGRMPCAIWKSGRNSGRATGGGAPLPDWGFGEPRPEPPPPQAPSNRAATESRAA